MQRSQWRFGALVVAALAGCPATVGIARAQQSVSMGVVGSISDAPFFIAEAKGYFVDEGLKVDISTFDSAANMIAPMGIGQLDVGAGAVSVGLFNAIERGLRIKIVADKARNSPGYSYSSIMVRKALIDSGKVKSFADFKGLKIAVAGPGITDLSTIDQAMRKGGNTIDDAEIVFLGMGQHIAAYANGAIDASLTAEPSTTRILDQGSAVRFASIASFYPNQQTAVVLFSEQFLKNTDAASRFMRAYLRAARFYNDALKDGHFFGDRGEEVVDILSRYSSVKDKALLRRISPSAIDSSGQVDMRSLAIDVAFFVQHGWVKDPDILKRAVDLSVVTTANAQLDRNGAH
jgi:NitT/TauT family transport system substrate-binding protein